MPHPRDGAARRSRPVRRSALVLPDGRTARLFLVCGGIGQQSFPGLLVQGGELLPGLRVAAGKAFFGGGMPLAIRFQKAPVEGHALGPVGGKL